MKFKQMLPAILVVLFLLPLSLSQVLFTNSHQISGVPISTTVDAAVTAYSNWYGAPPVKNTFRSPPALPSLVKASQTNTSIDATLTITEQHSKILNITVYLLVVETYQRISPTDNANVNVSSHPAGTVLLYNFTGLKPNTQYQLMTEGDYLPANLNGNKFQAINISNPGSVIRTDAGVPDRPRGLMVMNDELSWTRPNNNGRPILRYTLRYSGIDDVDEPMPRTIDDGTAKTYDLNQLGLAVDSTYNLSLVAVNSVGESDESDVIMYIVPLPWNQTLLFIVDVPVGGFLIILIFILLFILCYFFCCCSLSVEGQARFGPDYQLSTIVNQKSHDDYNSINEDLDLLTFLRNNLSMKDVIDRGEFGVVREGTAQDILGPSTGPTPVAIKILIGQSPEEQRKFLSEAVLMRHFNHLNIVKVLGVCRDNDPIYIIMELMSGGDLLKFLREARRDNGPALLTLQELVQISLDVAQGCRYLEQQRFIHRYIAARNCLVSSKGADRIVKIGNFGLAEDLLYSTDYYQVEDQERLPVRWIAPEALLQGKFTFKSDIWSYGVLLWEIMTLGNQPYHGRTNQEVRQFVTGGGRLERPDNCPSQLYKVMQCCWKEYASERPHFTQIVEFVSNFLDHVNNKRDSYCSDNEEEDIDEASYCCDDEEEDIEEALQHRPSRPSRSSSARSFGLLSLARQGSMRIRNSLRRRRRLHCKEELDSHANDQSHTGMNS